MKWFLLHLVRIQNISAFTHMKKEENISCFCFLWLFPECLLLLKFWLNYQFFCSQFYFVAIVTLYQVSKKFISRHSQLLTLSKSVAFHFCGYPILAHLLTLTHLKNKLSNIFAFHDINVTNVHFSTGRAWTLFSQGMRAVFTVIICALGPFVVDIDAKVREGHGNWPSESCLLHVTVAHMKMHIASGWDKNKGNFLTVLLKLKIMGFSTPGMVNLMVKYHIGVSS